MALMMIDCWRRNAKDGNIEPASEREVAGSTRDRGGAVRSPSSRCYRPNGGRIQAEASSERTVEVVFDSDGGWIWKNSTQGSKFRRKSGGTVEARKKSDE
ncbi:hypothetical protein CDL15_Pgr000162 [Punica granatum]|uniref:Uncharacterized protein n=1 Tax=Punica granatum TaxID=22663 RepID=A0A218Y2C6_PUNGR|nr:hypothetical protein CDL15_Pgr000162 [Punica granatum]PKI79479.1 hypothetical protein CRG98_000110 [Punica granatum]